jgi:hypothetical protein
MRAVTHLLPAESHHGPTKTLEEPVSLDVRVSVNFSRVDGIAVDLHIELHVRVGEVTSCDEATLIPDLVIDLGHWEANAVEQLKGVDLRGSSYLLVSRVAFGDEFTCLPDTVASLSGDPLDEIRELLESG